MEECFNCFISGTKAQLLDGISGEGIIKVCAKCSEEENIPLVRKPNNLALEESEKRQTVYERLSRTSGVAEKTGGKKELKKQETSLREIVDRNVKFSVKEEIKPRNDLVDNFHWVLMRMRRLKKITPEQLGEKIGESAMAIKMAEKGRVPNGYEFIRKLENYFGVKLIKDNFRPKEKPKIQVVDSELLGQPEEIFEEDNSKVLTISDLQKMKKKKERGFIFNRGVSEEDPEFVGEDEIGIVDEESVESFPPEASVPPAHPKESLARPKKSLFNRKKESLEDESFAPPKEKNKKEGDISQEEIDKILFGK